MYKIFLKLNKINFSFVQTLILTKLPAWLCQ